MRIDAHTHTKYSPCSNLEPEVVPKLARRVGLDAVAVTDHDTIKGGLAVKKANRDKDLEVIVGAEMSTHGGSIIGLYLNKEIRRRDPFEVVDEIHAQGGLVMIPHPFDVLGRENIDRGVLEQIIKKVDLIEGINARSCFLFNRRALRFAKEFKKPALANSDAHFALEFGRAYTICDKITRPKKLELDALPCSWPFLELSSHFISILRKMD
jgi:hypothetical protein